MRLLWQAWVASRVMPSFGGWRAWYRLLRAQRQQVRRQEARRRQAELIATWGQA